MPTAFSDYFTEVNNGSSSGRLLQFPNTVDVTSPITDSITGQTFTISGDLVGQGGRDSIVVEPSDKGGMAVTDGTRISTGMGSSSHYYYTYLFNFKMANVNAGVRTLCGGYHFGLYIIDGYLCYQDSYTPPLSAAGSKWAVYKLEVDTNYSIIMTSDRFGGFGNTTLVKFYVNGAKVGDSEIDDISILSSRYSIVNSIFADYFSQATTYLGKTTAAEPDDAIVSDVGYMAKAITEHQASKLTSLAKYNVGSATISGTIIEAYQASDFLVRAHRTSDGSLVAQESTNSGSFSMIVPDLEYYVIVLAEQGSVWEPNLIYGLGMKVYPTNPSAKRFCYICTTAGSSGEFEPDWNVTELSTTIDGDAVWTIFEGLIQPITHAPVRGI